MPSTLCLDVVKQSSDIRTYL